MMGAFGGIAGYGGGPERSGCGYSSDAAVYGYDHFIVPDVQREHPDWAPEQVRQEALIRFNFRFSENIASLQCERKGESSTTVWREEALDGERTLVIHGGKYDGYTMDRFWHESFQYDREKGTARSGSVEEYHAQKKVQQAILNGEATSSASIIGHPESVKLIQTFYRGNDGLYYSEQIDLEGLTGRTLTFAEGKAVMAALHHDHKQSAKIAEAHHDHFMVTQGKITASEVKTIAQAIVLTSPEPQPTAAQGVKPEDKKQMLFIQEALIPTETRDVNSVRGNMFVDTSRIVFHDSREAIRGIAVFLRDKEKRKEGIDRIRRVFVSGENSIDNHSAAAFSLSMRQTSERLTIEKIREKPVRVVKEIEKRHAEMRKSVAALLVAADTKVALGAAPLVLAALVKEQPKRIRAVEKSARRHKRRELRMKNYELRRKAKRETKKVSVKVQPLKTERVEPLRAAKERKGRKKRTKVYMGHPAGRHIYTFERQKKRLKENIVKRVAVAEKLTPIERKKSVNPERVKIRRLRWVTRRAERVLEAKRAPKKERKLWVVLAVASVELTSKESVLRGWSEERPKRAERVVVAGVRFAWALWILFHENAKKRDPDVRWDDKIVSKHERTKILDRDPTPWILLSIIYYLTAIREHTMRNNPMSQSSNTTNTTNKQKKATKRIFPQFAVIYAFAS